MIKFNTLTINNWKQFESLDLRFHENLTVLTGANGSGKTTLLNLLSQHFNWYTPELATPFKNKNTGGFSFIKRLLTRKSNNRIEVNSVEDIGNIAYTNGSATRITIPIDSIGMTGMPEQAQYSLMIENQQQVKGLNIPSHRPLFFYQNVANVPTQKRTNIEAYRLAFEKNSNRYNNHGGGGSVSFVIKETLISWAIAGGGNKFMQADMELELNFRGFEDVLKLVLPKTLGFQEISIRNYEVVLACESGDFMIDGASGGISAIIDLAWQIYNYYKDSPEGCVVLIDEVENHLHPSMQRSILPDFIKAFPNIQFIVSTHSPLIIGSVKESSTYALRYNENKKIVAEVLDLYNKAKNATEILNEVLGVGFTMPIWVEDKLNSVVRKYSSLQLNENTFEEMRSELKEFGMEELMPHAIKGTIKNKHD